jgi:hypothetical protein
MHRRQRMVAATCLVAAAVNPLTAGAAGAGEHAGGGGGEPRPYRMVWDDFGDGFVTDGPDARWSYVAGGGYVGDDGIEQTSRRGLHVRSSGTNPVTGAPAFVNTIAQEDDNPTGHYGGADHAKWLVYADHTASTGFAGFDAVPGQELSCSATMSGEVFGTEGHPFGDAVEDPDDDLRLASVMLNTIDNETSTAFDFVLTNDRIYAFYGRPPFARGTLGNYAAFSHTIPLARRDPGDRHHFRIAYDRSAGVVRWLIDGEEAFRVDRIGLMLDRDTLTLDHGGVETPVAPRQLSCGMGLLSLMDGSYPTGQALVRLSSADDHYFGTDAGQPVPQVFVDEESRGSSRLFGQGAELDISRFVVSSQPSRGR